ncbi:MAG: Mur ligase family protein [Erysipelotrichales bacterium]|nr:Mur ligase family protein [Erysipelotrichales bacterium]
MKLSQLKEKLINSLPENMIPIGIKKVQEAIVKSESVPLKSIDESNSFLGYQKTKSLGALNAQSNINEDTSQYNGGNMVPLSDNSFYNAGGANPLDEIKVIGVVGSRGKTTVSKIIHDYLKALGKKSMLYSSAKIDSPAGFADPNEGSETPLRSEGILLQILHEAENFQPEFIVLEVNESAISEGLAKDIPFVAKVLTNIFTNHHIDLEPTDQYVANLKSFFKSDTSHEKESFNESATAAVNVFGLTGNLTREDFNELLNLNSSVSYTFGSKHIAEIRNADYKSLDVLLFHCLHTINGLEMEVRVKEISHKLNTKMIMPYNALNITCALTVLDALNLLDIEVFQHIISDLSVPGREEVFNFQDHKVISGLYLFPILEILADYRNKGQINKIRLVTGATGTGFNGWTEMVSSDFFVSQRGKFRKEAMDYARTFVDCLYLTEVDSASEDPLKICEELQSYLGDAVTSEIIVDRKKAIRTAIEDCEPGDIVFIAGRGNRNALVISETEAILFKDCDVIKELMEEDK